MRPCVSGMLPVYATSMSVNPRAEAIVNVDLQGVRYVEMPWFIQPDHPAVMIYPSPRPRSPSSRKGSMRSASMRSESAWCCSAATARPRSTG